VKKKQKEREVRREEEREKEGRRFTYGNEMMVENHKIFK